jgi:hypothetical protein
VAEEEIKAGTVVIIMVCGPVIIEAKLKASADSASLPNSPTFGIPSISTLPKEEVIMLAATGSKSNWRKPQLSSTEKSSTEKSPEGTATLPKEEDITFAAI